MAAPRKTTPQEPVSGILVALQSFVGIIDGRSVTYVEGEPVRPGDPGVSRWPAMFGPLTFRAQPGPFTRVEQATAAPGEQR